MRALGVIQRFVDWAFARRRKGRYRAVLVEDVPRVLMPGSAYLVGEGEHRWSAAFRCPCGCRETIELNLVPEMRPRWRVTVEDDRTVAIEPSVWRQVGCRSHFTLIRGRIRWHADS